MLIWTRLRKQDCLWLNEAFATLMGESIILDRIYPEWKSSSEFINNHLTRALELDAKRSSHPIEVPLQGENVEDAVNQVFDAISYSKGASVLNMLSHMIGEDVFLKGVSIYLKNHLYGNAVTADLWAGISKSSGLDVGKIMGPWVLKQGFPVITVSEKDDAITVRQNRFLSTGDVKPEEDETLWYVPLALRTVGANGQATTDNKAVLDTERELTIPLKGAKDAVWKLNADTVGVYRVAYSPERLSKLGTEAAKKDSAFTLEDRVGLVSDASTLARAGYSKTSGALNLILALREEPTNLVNAAMANTLRQLASVWFEQSEPVREALSKFRADVFGPHAKRLGFESSEDESSETRDLRTTVVNVAVGADDPWAVEECKRRFQPILDSGDDSQVPNDLRQAVFSTVARLGGEAEYEALLKIYKNPATPNHKIAAMLAICAPKDEALLKRTVETLFSGEVKAQDFMYFFAGLAGNRVGRRLLWAETKARYDQLAKVFEGNFSLSRLIEYSFSSLTTKADLEDVQAFFKDKDVAKYSMGLQQGLDSVRANSQWLERDAADVEAWLKGNGYLDASKL
ncbi:Aminopeptidase 2 mitochondrial [Tilletia horrida]|uniref:Aminopeptidase 2 mitochondrial n=1 Tax=Tilletia horrida TaxID=155126 RepID=A0AAN6G7E8_9BASI|nr:Aminopeptidase 2 mitochondrial [Tilletia horrida]KAK0525966.1 Aminopeptidase 2 mitochondrial [Tilletia horrida]